MQEADGWRHMLPCLLRKFRGQTEQTAAALQRLRWLQTDRSRCKRALLHQCRAPGRVEGAWPLCTAPLPSFHTQVHRACQQPEIRHMLVSQVVLLTRGLLDRKSPRLPAVVRPVHTVSLRSRHHLSSFHQRRQEIQEFERSRLQDRHEHAPLLQPDDCSHPTICSATGYMQLCCRSQRLCCTGEQPQSATHTMTSVADSCRTPLQQWRGRAARPWPPPTWRCWEKPQCRTRASCCGSRCPPPSSCSTSTSSRTPVRSAPATTPATLTVLHQPAMHSHPMSDAAPRAASASVEAP